MSFPIQTSFPDVSSFPLKGWAAVTIAGKDREKFLSGLVTNVTKNLQNGEGNVSLLLTPKGRIIHEFLLASIEQSLVLLAPPDLQDRLFEHLDRYHFIEDLTLQKADPERQAWCITGAALPKLLERFDLQMPEPGKGLRLEKLFGESEALWATHLPLFQDKPTLILWSTAQQNAVIANKLQGLGCEPLAPEQVQFMKIVHNWYDTGELTDIFVHEAKLEHSHVSFTKGCYIGQETVARTHHRGKANKGLFLLHSEDEQGQLAVGASLLNEAGKSIGKVLKLWQLPGGQTAYRCLLRLASVEKQETIFGEWESQLSEETEQSKGRLTLDYIQFG